MMSLNLLFYYTSRMLKHIKPFPSWQRCLAFLQSVFFFLRMCICACTLLVWRGRASAASLPGPRSGKYSVTCNPATSLQWIGLSALCLAPLAVCPLQESRIWSTVGFRFNFLGWWAHRRWCLRSSHKIISLAALCKIVFACALLD